MNNKFYRHVRPNLDWWTAANNNKKRYDMTLVAVAHEDYIKIGIGVCSNRDQYSKAKGREEAEERLTYDPTFTFPVMHKNPHTSIYYWFKVLETMIQEDSPGIRNFVIAKQAKFDMTSFGIQRKKELNRRIAEEKEQRDRERAERIAQYQDQSV